MDSGLAGKTAVVTGGARGIGLACANALSAEGAKLVLADVDGPSAEASAATLPDALGFAVDVTDPDGVRQLIDTTVERHGGLDISVGFVGVDPDRHPPPHRPAHRVNARGIAFHIARSLHLA